MFSITMEISLVRHRTTSKIYVENSHNFLNYTANRQSKRQTDNQFLTCTPCNLFLCTTFTLYISSIFNGCLNPVQNSLSVCLTPHIYLMILISAWHNADSL